MKVVIGHYHLNPGGVTKIIQSQINGLSLLKNAPEMVVICDGQGQENVKLPEGVSFAICEKLGYLPKYNGVKELMTVIEEIMVFFMQLADKTDIIHFHNIGLGKNVAVTYALYMLAKEGYTVVNHAHDFPEDRPVNHKYLQDGLRVLGFDKADEVLYPAFANYTFGVLNNFDVKRLQKSGVPDDRINLWPNPVASIKVNENLSKEEAKTNVCKVLGLDRKKKLVAYPVRVIKRKNIGEYILLAAAFSEVANFIVTLPPLNPVEIELYQHWVEFCTVENIPITFEAGMKADFESVMRGADVCFTTSIMEGFGMVFVEPWLWDTPVAGRNIPAVLPDLLNLGIEYPLIYDEIRVRYENEQIDFAELDMWNQMKVIKGILKQSDIFVQQNSAIAVFFKSETQQIVNRNKEIIIHDLSERKYGEKLYTTYQALS